MTQKKRRKNYMKEQKIKELISYSPLDLFHWFYSNGTYLNVPIQLVYNKVIPLTLGDEILFDSDNVELVNFLNYWADKTKLYEKCRLLVAQSSIVGKSMAFLLRNGLGELDLYIPTYPQMSGVAKVNEQEELAVIWTNLNKSDTPSFAKITITKGACAIQEFAATKQLRVQDASTFEGDLTPRGETKIAKLDTNFFPLFEFVNKRIPDFGFQNTSYLSGIPDWWLGRKLLFDIEESLEQKFRERKKNQTRAFGEMDDATVANMKKGMTDGLEEIFGDFMIRSTLGSYNTGGNKAITFIQGDPKLDTYYNDVKNTMSMFYESCGYNYRVDDNSGPYENKTKAITNNDLDDQTTKLKQKELLNGLYKLVDIVLADNGIEFNENGVRNYSINFATTSIVEKVQRMDLIERRINIGLLSRVEAIQLLDNVSKPIAENKLKEIDEDMMDKAALQQAMTPEDDEGENSSGNEKLEKEVI